MIQFPRVSVLIPTYNYARYLPEAIESVLEQDFADFEILISDDGSTDQSAEVIQRYADRDQRIRMQINRCNVGMVANWNQCLSQARGQYVKFLFGDDRLASPFCLTKMVRWLDEHPSAALAVSARKVMDERSNVVDLWDELKNPGLQTGLEVITRCLEQNRNLIGEPSVVLFRKEQAARGFDPQYRHVVDLEMWFHLLEAGDLYYSPEPLCSFRRHPLQQTEANKVGFLGVTELQEFLHDYLEKTRLNMRRTRKMEFAQLYNLRKLRRTTDRLRGLETTIGKSLGSFWYWMFWVHHKVTRPFSNLKRAVLRQFKRRQVSGGDTSPHAKTDF